MLSLWLYTDAHGLAYLIAFLAGAAAIVVFRALTVSPEVRRIDDAVAAADALASGRFDARMEVRDDEFAGLAAALNAAGGRTQALVTSLRQEREQLESLLNAGSDATIAVAADGVIVYMNDGARTMFGPAASAGKPFIEVVRDHDLNDVVVAAARRGERSVRVVPYGPAQRWLQATAVPIDGAGSGRRSRSSTTSRRYAASTACGAISSATSPTNCARRSPASARRPKRCRRARSMTMMRRATSSASSSTRRTA